MQKLDELIKVITNLKGIGKKNATRIAFDLLKKDEEEIDKLINTIRSCYDEIKPCKICSNLTDNEICDICLDNSRDSSIICIVEDTRDIFAFKNSSYRGKYHVLGGKIDPLNGVGVENLNIEQLLKRIDENVKEIIMALNSDLSGDTTVLYLKEILSSYDIKISKLASGLPVGSNIEYADRETLIQSLEGRIEIK